MTFGLQAGWLSPLQPYLQSENSPLPIPPLTIEEISWIGSLPSVSLVLAAPLFGYFLNRFGRKITCFLSTAPNLLHYILLIFADNVYMIYAARLIGGFCSCGAFVMAPIYISEIAEDHLRGKMGGLVGFFIKIGMILSFVLGGYASYQVLNVVSLSFTVFFLIFYKWMPESPVYLVTVNKRKEAGEALKKLRGSNYTLVEKELSQIDDLIAESQKNTKNFSLKTFFTTPAIQKGLLMVCGVYFFQMMTGYAAMVRYAVNIFQNSTTALSPNLAAISIAIAQLLSSLVGASLIDKLGRKSILIIATSSIGLNFVLCSTYMLNQSYFDSTPYGDVLRFVPVVTLILVLCSYGMGYGSVPFVILPEFFAPEARATASTIANSWISFVEFIVIKIFPSLSHQIGLALTFLIFAGHCFIGVAFYHFVLLETKNLDFETIYKKLSKSGKVDPSESINKETWKPLTKSENVI